MKTPTRSDIAFLVGLTVACALGLAFAVRVVHPSANFIAANLALGATLVLVARVWPTRWRRGSLILLFAALFVLRRITEHYFPGHGDSIDAIFVAALGAFGLGSGVTKLFFAWHDKINGVASPRATI